MVSMVIEQDKKEIYEDNDFIAVNNKNRLEKTNSLF